MVCDKVISIYSYLFHTKKDSEGGTLTFDPKGVGSNPSRELKKRTRLFSNRASMLYE